MLNEMFDQVYSVKSIFSSKLEKLLDNKNRTSDMNLVIRDNMILSLHSAIIETFIPGLYYQFKRCGGKFHLMRYNDLSLPSTTVQHDLSRLIMWHYGVNLSLTSDEIGRTHELAIYLKCDELKDALEQALTNCRKTC